MKNHYPQVRPRPATRASFTEDYTHWLTNLPDQWLQCRANGSNVCRVLRTRRLHFHRGHSQDRKSGTISVNQISFAGNAIIGSTDQDGAFCEACCVACARSCPYPAYSLANSYPWSPFPPRRARPGPGPHKVHSCNDVVWFPSTKLFVRSSCQALHLKVRGIRRFFRFQLPRP